LDQYAVMGNPVAHSLSPLIHTEFARQTHQNLNYQAIEVEPGRFAEAVSTFFVQGGKGLNVTVPFKQEAWELAQTLSPDAEIAGAVNTLLQDSSGKLQGHNTDGIGLVRDIKDNLGASLQGKTVLILGAGGATRGILLPILREQPARVIIANRTASKAELLAADFSQYGPVKARAFQDLDDLQADWLINATSASLKGELPPLSASVIDTGSACYDLMYSKRNSKQGTPFCAWAQNNGAALVADGLGMLVEQAAEAFYLWRGLRPQTRPVISALR
jgi:shikimate dehydrogenase